jgi:hypothetical protein
METSNRSALVVLPARHFLEWLHHVEPTSGHLSLDDLRIDPAIYLVPECRGQTEAVEYLREVCSEIFEEQLNGWHRVRSAWPTVRDLNRFLLWFEWSLHSTIIDLDETPIEHEEI